MRLGVFGDGVLDVLADFATEFAVPEQRRVDCLLVIELEIEE